MARFKAQVSNDGAIALPESLKEATGIRNGDVVELHYEHQSIIIEKVVPSLESVRGSIPTPPHMVGRDLDEMIEEATADHADWLMRQERGVPR